MARVHDWHQRACVLARYIPEPAIEVVLEWQNKHRFQLRIARTRATKHGDYRPPQGEHPYHRISVNHDLNEYAFLLTLTHEVAHLITWERYKQKAKPHGREWQLAYSELLRRLTDLDVFPNDVLEAVHESIDRPAASSCAEVDLLRILRKYDREPAVFLEELEIGEQFGVYNGRVFEKGEQRRTRFVCKEVDTGRLYLFSPVASVKRVKQS